MALCKRISRRVPTGVRTVFIVPRPLRVHCGRSEFMGPGDIQASAPVGGVIPTIFPYPANKCELCCVDALLGRVGPCAGGSEVLAGSRPGASCGGVRAREAERAGTALEGVRTARRYARTSRRSTSRLRARRRPCEGFLGMRSDAHAYMRERARFFVATSSLRRLGSSASPTLGRMRFSPPNHR